MFLALADSALTSLDGSTSKLGSQAWSGSSWLAIRSTSDRWQWHGIRSATQRS